MTAHDLTEQIARAECTTNADWCAAYGLELAGDEARRQGESLRENQLDNLVAEARRAGLPDAEIRAATFAADRIVWGPRGDRRRAEAW